MKKFAKFALCAVLLMTAASLSAQDRKPYRLALRTNVLYDAMLYPTLGLEWRPNYCLGIKLDASYSDWDVSGGDHQAAFMVSPEIRWYMCAHHRFYLGVGGNVGKFGDINGGSLYKAMDVLYGLKEGYTYRKGKLYNAGLVIGYQFDLGRALALDLNIGAGYNKFKFDVNTDITYQGHALNVTVPNMDVEKWGLTQAGVTLAWKFLR